MNIRTKLNLNALVVIGELANITYIRSTPLFKMADPPKNLPQSKAYISAKTQIGSFFAA